MARTAVKPKKEPKVVDLRQVKIDRLPPSVSEKQIDTTTEYDVFQRLPGNRPVDEGHVKRLMIAMTENYLFSPIHVNQDFQVIDGQHRLEAHRRLNLPIPFYWVEGGTLENVQGLNAKQKKWSNEDYVNSYIERGFKDYETYKWFRAHYGLPHEPSMMLLMGYSGIGGRQSQHFREGRFKVRNLPEAKKKVEMLKELEPYFKHWKNAGFIKAFLIALGREGFDFKVFLHRVKVNPTMLQPCTSIDAYLQLIEEAYNYRATKKVAIRFGQDAVSKLKGVA